MILVTGATGTIGSALVPELRRRGADVRAFVRTAASRAALEARGVAVVEGDLDRPESLPAALDGCDRVFLLSPPHPQQAEREQAVVDAAARAGVRHLVALSVMGADPQSPFSFGRAHAAVDGHLQASGLGSTVLRPAGFMQTHLVPATLDQGVWYGMTGDGASGWIDAADIAAAAAAELTADSPVGGVRELTGPQAVSMPEAAAQLAEVLGREVAYVDLPPDAFRGGLVGAGVPEEVADAIVGFYAIIREGHAATVTSSVQELAGRPPHSYRQFVEANPALFAGGAGAASASPPAR